MDFEAAKQAVLASDRVREAFGRPADFMVGEAGWESATEFRVVAGTRRDVTGEGDFGDLTMDAPMVLVNKATGVIRLVYWHRVVDENPAAGMTPVGDVSIYN